MKKSLLLLGLLAAFNANANLIQNNGFEGYVVTPGTAAHIISSGTTCAVGTTCIPNTPSFAWEPTSSAPTEFLEVRNAFFGSAQGSSNNFAELNPSAPSGFQQKFTAVAGTGLLSWWDKGRSANGSDGDGVGDYDYTVSLNGIVFNDTTTGTENWRYQIFNVVLIDGVNTLSFVSNSPNDVGAQIDNISLIQVAAIPEPETYGMMMLGLAMLGFASRRRKQ